jgi:hypothetical protein
MKSFTTRLKEFIESPAENIYRCFLYEDPTRFYTGFGPVPALVKCTGQSASWPEPGAERRLFTRQNHSSREMILHADAHSRIKIISDSFTDRNFDFIDRMECELLLHSDPSGRTHVDWEFTFVSTRSHFKARMLSGAIFPPAHRKAMANLKHYAESRNYSG